MSDFDDLKLPPRRPLPAEVHDRMRATVLTELHAPARSRADRARRPLAVAAAVAVLAAGGAIVAQSIGGGDGKVSPVSPNTSAAEVPPPPKAPPLDLVAAQANLDRCWAAVQQAGKAATVPARDTWTPVFAVPNTGRTLTAVRAEAKPLFCETTETTVTVSDPNATPVYAKGSKTGALIMSSDGAMGGVADPTWLSLDFVDVGQSGASGGGPAIVQDGFFVWFNEFAQGPGTRSTVRQTVPGHPETPLPVPVGGVSTQPRPGEPEAGRTHAELDLPRAPAALVAVTDRPGQPQDRTSELGAFLGECIAKSDSVVVDPTSWAAMASTTWDSEFGANRYLLTRSGDRVSTCMATAEPNGENKIVTRYQFEPVIGHVNQQGPVGFTRWMPAGRNILVVLGLVRSDVATMELIDGAQNTVPVPVTNGAFGATFSGSWPEDIDSVIAVLRDGSGKELYRGPLPDTF